VAITRLIGTSDVTWMADTIRIAFDRRDELDSATFASTAGNTSTTRKRVSESARNVHTSLRFVLVCHSKWRCPTR
jgi:hypothetical protein